jgi:tetratricopeptide (TPR) repeat protein
MTCTVTRKGLPAFARTVCAITLVAAVSACSTSGTKRREPVTTRTEAGFTITDRIDVGGGVRGDFEEAVRLLEQERYAEAAAALREVAEAAPDATAVHVDLAIAYRHLDDLEQAEKSLDRALELNPRHPVALVEMGIVYRRTGRFTEARERYEQTLGLYPDYHFARKNLGILCDLFIVDPGCALEQYELYNQAVPEDEEVAIWIADLKNRAGR